MPHGTFGFINMCLYRIMLCLYNMVAAKMHRDTHMFSRGSVNLNSMYPMVSWKQNLTFSSAAVAIAVACYLSLVTATENKINSKSPPSLPPKNYQYILYITIIIIRSRTIYPTRQRRGGAKIATNSIQSLQANANGAPSCDIAVIEPSKEGKQQQQQLLLGD